MHSQRSNAPRRYFVDESGHRVMIGLSCEETTEFEMLDGADLLAGDGREEVCDGRSRDGRSRDGRERRWSELYYKHDEAWRLWIAQNRVEQAASSGFVNHG